jgi:predicted RNA-binding Zn-ribbon protein involved in translation (DUF1610 family)/TM2 domain-containing membrane protein YozV
MAIAVNCPTCGSNLKIPEKFAGQRVKCPDCGKVLAVPDLPSDEDEVELVTTEPARSGRRDKGYREKYCHECGAQIRAKAVICPKCGVEQPVPADRSFRGGRREGGNNRIGAGVCGILIGGLGIHKFILGLTGPGLTMLLVSIFGAVLTPCLIAPILAPFTMGIIGLIEGIIYLSKSDEDFYQTYIVDKRGWF